MKREPSGERPHRPRSKRQAFWPFGRRRAVANPEAAKAPAHDRVEDLAAVLADW